MHFLFFGLAAVAHVCGAYVPPSSASINLRTARVVTASRAAAALATASTTATASSAASTDPSVVDAETRFVRTNPMSDRFEVLDFHHVELYCSDANSAAGRFAHALGMDVLATSGPQTGNSHFTSITIGSGDVRMAFTAPLGATMDGSDADAAPETGVAAALAYDAAAARDFVANHGGIAVRAVCVRVSDVEAAYDACVSGGGEGVLPPRSLWQDDDATSADAPSGAVAEVKLYGDVVLRLLSLDDAVHQGRHLPGYVDAATAGVDDEDGSYGIRRFDHIVGNVWELQPTLTRLRAMTGFHDFAEFTAEDVGTVDSGLNSAVLASNSERVLLPVNEPTYGTKRRSQIETYLVTNKGEGVQHMALFTDDIFSTIRQMRAAGRRGGFQFMDAPSDAYYEELPSRIGDALSAEEYASVRELGLLVDRDPEGVLIQVFTKPVGDRPTLVRHLLAASSPPFCSPLPPVVLFAPCCPKVAVPRRLTLFPLRRLSPSNASSLCLVATAVFGDHPARRLHGPRPRGADRAHPEGRLRRLRQGQLQGALQERRGL